MPDLFQGQQTVYLPPPPRRVRSLILTVTLAWPPAKLSTAFEKSSQHSHEVLLPLLIAGEMEDWGVQEHPQGYKAPGVNAHVSTQASDFRAIKHR